MYFQGAGGCIEGGHVCCNISVVGEGQQGKFSLACSCDLWGSPFAACIVEQNNCYSNGAQVWRVF